MYLLYRENPLKVKPKQRFSGIFLTKKQSIFNVIIRLDLSYDEQYNGNNWTLKTSKITTHLKEIMEDIEFKNRLTRTVAETVARLGTAVAEHEDQYGWKDHAAVHHRKGLDPVAYKYVPELECSWVCPDNPEIEEAYITEFVNTFTDNDDTAVINLFHVSCTCGKFTDRTLRYEGTIAGFIPQMFLND